MPPKSNKTTAIANVLVEPQQTLDSSEQSQRVSKSTNKHPKSDKKSKSKSKPKPKLSLPKQDRSQSFQFQGKKYSKKSYILKKITEAYLDNGIINQYDRYEVIKINNGSQQSSLAIQSNGIISKGSQVQINETNILEHILCSQPGFTIQGENIIEGTNGHGRIFFKRPIIEGNYYIRVKILSCGRIPQGFKNPSSVRIGLCETTYKQGVSIGSFQNSIAYRSDGLILLNGKKQGQATSYGEKDNIIIQVNFAPLHKHKQLGQLNKRMSLSFYHNKIKVFSMIGLPDMLYSFAIGLFNKAKVQLFYRFQDEGEKRRKRNYQRIGDYCEIFEASFFRRIQYKELMHFNFQDSILNVFRKANKQREKEEQKANLLRLIQGQNRVKREIHAKQEQPDLDQREESI